MDDIEKLYFKDQWNYDRLGLLVYFIVISHLAIEGLKIIYAK